MVIASLISHIGYKLNMNHDKDAISHLVLGMREAYEKGENAMAWARGNVTSQENILVSTLIAYALQAGSYRDIATKNPKYFRDWSIQLAKLIKPTLGIPMLRLEYGTAVTKI
jgi:hypothetical protein